MNPHIQDRPCPGGCGQTISYNKEFDDWSHSGLHDASCPFKQYEPMRHKAIMGFTYGKWKFNEQGEIERAPEKPATELPLAPVISMAEFRAKKESKNT
jgi:hypothetical protein